ncbi:MULTISPECIES: 2-amino-4-hydroxy-6-hydroxymethyldihydropteridine diphosphokinase [unclassified Salinisphaera]|uniref:2-amino-4-hydroxy-6- hydroxymethyldihydropteridine diphosphokinase n=1 Tax=unclassified Salinisphaera TaxID=2649847 RepID=UPI003340E6ED
MKPLETSRDTPRVSVAWIGLGSNLQSPADQLTRALDTLGRTPQVHILAVSSFYRTLPVGGPPGQPMFCNACAALATTVSARALLDRMHAIEAEHGRVRDVRWGARTLDLDLLAYDDMRCHDPALQLPHPRAFERGFVLVPLAEIAPALVLEGYGRVVDRVAGVDRQGVERWDCA